MRLARLLPLFAALLIVSCFSAQAEEPSPNGADVSQALSTEIDLDIEALPPKGPPKLESSLWRLVEAERRGGAAELSAEAQRSAIALQDGAVRVIIEAKDGQSATAIASARSSGATVETSYGDLVQVVVPVATLERLADDPSARFVRQPTRYFPAVITGEGVGLVNADDWHAAGVGGSGVKVAVLDGGFSGYSSLLGSELPSSVTTQSFRADGRIDLGFDDNPTVHGTAVAEIVHEMAPDVQLYLVNFQTDPELANAVSWIVGQGVDVINFSIGCSVCAPGDGTGFDNDLVSSAVSSGIVWSNAAGNEAQNHWTGMWNNPDGDQWLNFNGADETSNVILYGGEAIWIEMKWTDSWPAGCNDYGLAIYNSASVLVTYSNNVQDCYTAPPAEYMLFVAPYDDTFHVAIYRTSAAGAPRFHLYWTPLYWIIEPPPGLEYVVAARSLSIPADNPDAVSVGAVDWSTPGSIEPFSSQGPTEDGRTKPDLVAPDYVSGATYGPSGFPGTSAASPHVAGAAALVKQAYPSYSPAQIKSFLEGRAVPLGAPGKDNVYGSGRLDLGGPPIVDSDGDGVPDESDNCPETYDTGNGDNDGDSIPGTQPPPGATWGGDACDADDDNDLMLDTYEDAYACLDPLLADGGENADGDELRNYPEMVVGSDPCVANPELALDSDGDGGSDGRERYIGTDPLDDCTNDGSPKERGTHDAWHFDINIDTWSNVLDMLLYKGHLQTQVGDPNYDRRLDLNADGWVNILDMLLYKGHLQVQCTNP